MSYFDSIQCALDKYERLYPEKIRMVAIKMIFRNIKWLIRGRKNSSSFYDNKIHIMFELDGGLGDLLVALNYIENFKTKIAQEALIDISVPSRFYEEVNVLLQGYDFVGNVVKDSKKAKNYDLEIKLVRIPVVMSVNTAKASYFSPKLQRWVEQVKEFCLNYPEYIKAGTVADGLLSWRTLMQGQNRLSQADVINKIEVEDIFRIKIDNVTNVLNKFNLAEQQYIVVQNGVGLALKSRLVKMATRDWPTVNFAKLVELLKHKYPSYKVVQVGYTDHEVIDGLDYNLLGQTNFVELLTIINSAKLVIAAESGVIHFRHFTSSQPSVVLFGPTRPEMYGYSENTNIVTEICQGCEWKHNDWRNICLKNSSNVSACMKAITPEMVMEKIERNKLL